MEELMNIPEWTLRGDWFDVCSCDIACPCEFAQAPTGNRCQGILAYHVRQGTYGDARLDDLNVIGVSEFSGNLWAGEGQWAVGLYIDERADGAQREALEMIFSGRAGGFMAKFAALIGDFKGIEYLPITFEVADDLAYWRAEVPGKVLAAAEALSGPMTPAGARVQLLNAPGSEVGPGQVATWGKATADEVDAYGFRWDWKGKSSKHIPFDWTGPR
jgi:hypothetical protein